MADSTSLLPSCPSDQKNRISSTSAAQLFQAFFVSFAWVFDAQQTFITVFTDSTLVWHLTNFNTSSSYTSSSLYSLPAESWAWDRPSKSSIISEWSLQCASSFITGLPSSSYFFGCLLGGLLLATLADSSLGRKNMLFLSCSTMSLAGLLTTASPNIWIYSLLRFLTGFSRATIGTSALVLSIELVGKSSRGEVGIIGFFCFTLGFLSLPAAAYLTETSPGGCCICGLLARLS